MKSLHDAPSTPHHPPRMQARLVVGMLASALIAAGCTKEAPTAPSAAGQRPAVEVGTVTATPGDVGLVTELPGRVEASKVAQVRARAAGILQQRMFKEGSDVKAGQTLFRIDEAPYAAALDSAKANQAKAEANLAQTQAQLERYRPLVEANAISKQDFVNAEAAVKQSQADVASTKAAVRTAGINLGYATVTAPISGRIGRALVTEGALVGQGEATPLAVIQQIDPVYVNFTQSANDILQLRKAMASGQFKRAVAGGQRRAVQVRQLVGMQLDRQAQRRGPLEDRAGLRRREADALAERIDRVGQAVGRDRRQHLVDDRADVAVGIAAGFGRQRVGAEEGGADRDRPDLAEPPRDPQRNLGQIAGVDFGGRRGSKTLVLADSPNKLTGAATLKKAIAQRDNLWGGWDRVVVLGWNFDPSIGETITALNDNRLEVLVIPPDLLDRLRKKGGVEKLRGQVRFSSLQYLTLHPVQRRVQGNEETLSVRLKNYVLLSPEAINLDDANRAKLQAVANAEPLALIEYWAVDPDYDGQVFRSVWQDYRGNVANDGDPLRVTTQALLTVPAKAGLRRVCVRVVDVFGFEAEVVSTVDAID